MSLLLPFLWVNHIALDGSLFVYPFNRWTFGPFVANVSSAAMDVHIQVCFNTCFPFLSSPPFFPVYPGVELLGYGNSVLNLLRSCQIVFQGGYAITFALSMHKGSNFPTSLSTLIIIVIIF